MTGKIAIPGVFVIALVCLVTLAAAPGFAQEAEEPRTREETCVEVTLNGDDKFEIPCPPGLRPFLEGLPRLVGPSPRRGIVIDPDWPHDQAMDADHDWPYDSAMIVPQADEAEDTPPPILDGSLDELLSLFGQDFNDLTSLPEQDSLDTWEPKLQAWRYINEDWQYTNEEE